MEPRALMAEALSSAAVLDAWPTSDAVEFNGAHYFFATDERELPELWKTDGTEAGTVRVTTVPPPRDFGAIGHPTPAPLWTNGPGRIVVAGDAMYFVTRDEARTLKLWRSDGTAAGTGVVPGDYTASSDELAAVGGHAYFTAFSAGAVDELWRAGGDGAARLAVNLTPTWGESSRPRSLQVVNGSLYFGTSERVSSDFSTSHSGRVWRVDPAPAGGVPMPPVAVTALGVGPMESPPFLQDVAAAAGGVFLTNVTPAGQERLWGPGGAAPLAELPGIQSPTEWGGALLFASVEGGTKVATELWRSDGTPGGTAPFFDPDAVLPADVGGAALADRGGFVPLGGALYFFYRNGLWRTDGTAAGSALVKQFAQPTLQQPESFGPQLRAVDGKLCFVADDGAHGNEVWFSDGTAAGTHMVADLHFRTADGAGRLVGTVGDDLLFNAYLRDATPFQAGEPRPYQLVLMRFDLDGEIGSANAPPVASAGPAGGYVLGTEDRSVRLDATGSSDPDGDVLTYAWDLNGDDRYEDAFGPTPELTRGQLQVLGVEPYGEDVRVRVSDGRGGLVESTPVRLAIPPRVGGPGELMRAAFGTAVGVPADRGPAMVPDSAGTGYVFGIVFASRAPLDMTTFGDGDVLVSGPGGFTASATAGAVDDVTIPGMGAARQVTFRFDAPGGTADAADAGSYTVRLAAASVEDEAGNTVREAVFDGVRVVLELTPPTAAATLPSVDASDFFDFVVTYRDDTAIDPATIDDSVLHLAKVDVAGPAGYSAAFGRQALALNKAPAADGNGWTVTYRVGTPDGIIRSPIFFTGTFAVLARDVATAVKDVYGNPLPPAELTRFDVTVPTEGPDLVVTDAAVSLPRGSLPGAKGRATALLKAVRVGAATAPVSTPPVDVGFYLSADTYPDATDTLVATVKGRRAGAKPQRVSAAFVVPDIAVGNYRVIAVVDADRRMAEPSDGNNRSEAPTFVEVGVPQVRLEMQVRRQSPDRRLRRGGVLALVVEVTNDGNVTAAGPARLHATLTPAAPVPVGGAPHEPAAGEATVRLNLRPDREGRTKARLRLKLRVPASWAEGTAILEVILDPQGALAPLVRDGEIKQTGAVLIY